VQSRYKEEFRNWQEQHRVESSVETPPLPGYDHASRGIELRWQLSTILLAVVNNIVTCMSDSRRGFGLEFGFFLPL
jgi:hypothetical protein